MTDWATRVSTPDNPMKEMQSSAPAVDVSVTIEAIRRLINEQEHLLPADIVPVARTRQIDAEDAVAQTAMIDRKPARKNGLLAALRPWRR